MDPAKPDIFHELDEMIRVQKEIEHNPFFYTRVRERLDQIKPEPAVSWSWFFQSLLRPVPASVLVSLGLVLGVLLVNLSDWADYQEERKSYAVSDEAFKAYTQGYVDQSVFDSYYNNDNSESYEPSAK